MCSFMICVLWTTSNICAVFDFTSERSLWKEFQFERESKEIKENNFSRNLNCFPFQFDTLHIIEISLNKFSEMANCVHVHHTFAFTSRTLITVNSCTFSNWTNYVLFRNLHFLICAQSTAKVNRTYGKLPIFMESIYLHTSRMNLFCANRIWWLRPSFRDRMSISIWPRCIYRVMYTQHSHSAYDYRSTHMYK